MDRQAWRVLAPAAPTEVRVLARACAIAGALSGFAALVPFSDTAPVAQNAVMAVAGLALAAALWWAQLRTPAAVAHAVVLLATVCVTGAVAASTTPAGTAVTAVGCVWVALFSAVFHTRRAMLAHVALLLLGLGAALVAAGATSPLQTWTFIGGTTAMVASVVNSDVSRLRSRADVDALTGALTRSSFRTRAEHAMTEARRRRERMTLALIDLDDFKGVNDAHGHAAGDRLLADLARAWRTALGPRDLLGRHGGDEFVVLIRTPTRERPEATLARLREATTAAGWTVGVAEWAGDGFEHWLIRADEDLYRRKHSRPGR